jgi:hypothetical protein
MALTNPLLTLLKNQLRDRLGVSDLQFVEIESKMRVLPAQAKNLKKYLQAKKRMEHVKSAFSLDQFLDTPQMDLLRIGVSLRLRYRRNGSEVYLQYKGPGFKENGLLYRSELTSQKLRGILIEESHHDIIQFSKTPIRRILARDITGPMSQTMHKHLGADIINRISIGPIVCAYQKEKFKIKLGKAYLEPSLDRVFAFHINAGALHSLSTFWEFENEVKFDGGNHAKKLDYVPDLLAFNKKVTERFNLKNEPLDKYHRCMSIFEKHKR